MSWGISEDAIPKEKFWADINDTLKGFNSTAKIDYNIYCELYDELRKQFDIWVSKDFKDERKESSLFIEKTQESEE